MRERGADAQRQAKRRETATHGTAELATHIVVRGARQHNLKDIDARHPARQDDRLLRPERLRQELAGDGHDLCRGPAAVRRERSSYARQFLGQCRSRRSSTSTGCRRRSASSRRRRPEAALDRRHRHRDLRLPAHPLRPAGPALLPGLRDPDRHADGRRDRREDPGRAGGDEALPDGAGRSRRGEKYETLWDELRGAGLRPRAGRRQVATRSTSRRQSTTAASTRSRWSSTASSCAATPASRLADGRDRARPGQGRDARRPCRGRRGRARAGKSIVHSQHLRLRPLRPQLRAADAAQLLVQQPARLVPGLRGAGRAERRQPGRAAPRSRS